MKEVITPKMAVVFAHSQDDDEFSCSTCHGEGAESGNFDMPTADLPLNDEEIERHPAVAKFMAEKVVPEMRKLLGDDEFSCYDCHTRTD